MSPYALVSYALEKNARVGITQNGLLYDLHEMTGHPDDRAMLSLLSAWDAARDRLAFAREKIATGTKSGRPISSEKLLAPIPSPGTVFCAGANYLDHAEEMAKLRNLPPEPNPKTQGFQPWHFIKRSNSVIGPNEPITIPSGSEQLDWEVELVAVIGQPTKNVSVDAALSCVAGYTIANDVSARDLSRRNEVSTSSPFRFDWLAHKSFDTSCPMGPWIVPADQIGDPQDLKISLSINGEIKQQSTTSQMIFTLAEQISHLSKNMTLKPGDVVLTGTPAGVGSASGRFLRAGDRICASIERIGDLVNSVQ